MGCATSPKSARPPTAERFKSPTTSRKCTLAGTQPPEQRVVVPEDLHKDVRMPVPPSSQGYLWTPGTGSTESACHWWGGGVKKPTDTWIVRFDVKLTAKNSNPGVHDMMAGAAKSADRLVADVEIVRDAGHASSLGEQIENLASKLS